MTINAAEILAQGLEKLKLSVDEKPLLHYLSLLSKWNKTYNLTAIRKDTDVVQKHLLDSLAVIPFVTGQRIVDVGSGPGLPGIPLALACPEKTFVLLDSNGKKTRFMQAARRELGLNNIEVVQSRVESYHPKQTFATVISRAFADLGLMTSVSQHLLDDDGVWLAMKGRIPQMELDILNKPYKVYPYQVPTLNSERCVIIINHHQE